MNRQAFLKSLIGIPIIGAFIKKDEKLKFVTDGKSYNNAEDAANVIAKKFDNSPKWIDHLYPQGEAVLKHKYPNENLRFQIDDNPNSYTYLMTRLVHIPLT